MKKYILFFTVLVFVMGCGRSASQEKPLLAKIGNYELRLDEFEQEFKESSYARSDSLEARNDFLNSLVDRKLILQDAQGKGLDKEKNFLKMIERFWEQSLLKLALDEKTKEISGTVSVSDKEIEERYQMMFQAGQTDKPYEEMREQVKAEIKRAKGSKAINDWITELRKNAKVIVNYHLLK